MQNSAKGGGNIYFHSFCVLYYQRNKCPFVPVYLQLTHLTSLYAVSCKIAFVMYTRQPSNNTQYLSNPFFNIHQYPFCLILLPLQLSHSSCHLLLDKHMRGGTFPLTACSPSVISPIDVMWNAAVRHLADFLLLVAPERSACD